jgi:hypothetical protein
MGNEAPEVKQDWRIGLTVRVKYRNDPLYYERGVVLSAHPNGFGGIFDPMGVLRISLDSGAVILRGADQWITA